MKTLLLALLLITGSAWAEWVRVAWNDAADIYIDPATIRIDGGLRRVWEVQDLKQRGEGGKLSSRYRSEYDCKQERYKFLSLSYHSEAMASGTLLASEIGNDRWLDIPPGSLSERVLKRVCAR